LVWLSRYFLENQILFYVSSIFVGILILYIRTPVSNSILMRGKQKVPIVSAFYRNQIAMISGFIFYLIILVTFYFLDINYNQLTLRDTFLIVIIPLAFLAIINFIIFMKDKKDKISRK
jgi:hypothetical protein